MVFTRIVFQISYIIHNIHVTNKNVFQERRKRMKDFLIDILMHDNSFGQSLNTREKLGFLMRSGARKRNIRRAKSSAEIVTGIFSRSKELHKRKIESMLG